MPDVYATIAEVDAATQERLADILELRAADPQQRAMVESYLSRIELRAAGAGARDRLWDRCGHPGAGLPARGGRGGRGRSVTGVHRQGWPAGDRAGQHALRGRRRARALRFADGDFDAVVVHTTLCHVPQPERVLAEAARVLRPGGTLAVCDGDYATITVALGDADPLQACIEAVKSAFINDVWLVRRLPTLLRSAGFDVLDSCSHGYLQTSEPEYMLTLVDRGADTLASGARGGLELAAALKAEARRRVRADEFFGFIGFVSFIARKPTATPK